MPGASYLLDSNILLRWVKPDDRDYPLVVAAIDAILRDGGALCYTRKCRGVLERLHAVPLHQNGFGLSPQETDRRARAFDQQISHYPTAWQFTTSGAPAWNHTSPAFRCTMRGWWRPCASTASAGFLPSMSATLFVSPTFKPFTPARS